MKKTLWVVLTLVAIALLAVSCGTKAATAQVVILNNALPELETSYQCYNAKEWHKSYSMKEIVEDNFWYQPTDATEVSTGKANDTYIDGTLYGGDPKSTTAYLIFGFKNRYVSFMYLNPKYDYDLYVGRGMSESYQCWNQNFSVVGNEAILFVDDEVMLEDIFNTINKNTKQTVANAASWKLVDIDGKETVVTDAQLKGANLVLAADGKSADLEVAGKTIKVQSFAPETYTKDTKVAATECARFTVALNAKGVYGCEPKYEENRAGTYYPTPKTKGLPLAGSYATADLFNKYGVEQCESVDVVCYADGFTRTEAWDWFTGKYIAYHASNELITVGKVQAKSDDSVWQIGYFVTPKAVFQYIPADGTTLAKALEFLSFEKEPKKVNVTHVDGTVEKLAYADVLNMELAADSNVLKVEFF